MLETIAGDALPQGAMIIATAPPQHLYGLLFRVLWPLASGRPFGARTWLRPEELLPRLATHDTSVLVATPVHLRRLAGRRELRALRERLRLVVSSGGPLDADTAASLAADLGHAPLEVFGSTETGGVATRRQDERGVETPWTPLPGVQVDGGDASGPLVVRSPFVSVGATTDDGRQAFTMGDLVAPLADGRFRLLGRADRTVKIGEKRLHLPDMESRLREHAFVSEAALVTVEQAGEQRSAVVVVPSREGAAALADEGRRPVVRTLGEHLAPAFDRVLLPRAFRFVPELPRDSRGKTPIAALEGLFEGADAAPRDPVLLERDERADRIVDAIAVPVDLASFDGHFPGQPVVPGVVRLQWALELAAELVGTPILVRTVEALKFPNVLGPRDRATLEVVRDGERLRFVLQAGDQVYASGRVTVEAVS